MTDPKKGFQVAGSRLQVKHASLTDAFFMRQRVHLEAYERLQRVTSDLRIN
jgi:hypothetical protein